MMLTAPNLASVVSVRTRFTRSVNLERDFELQSAQEGYVITSLARSTLTRIAQGLKFKGGTRAWTLTGPYGSGKSAFALYLSGLLSLPFSGGLREATHRHLKQEDEELWRELFDNRRSSCIEPCALLPVLVTGSRESVKASVARGFDRALAKVGDTKALRLADNFREYLQLPQQEQTDGALLGLVENVARQAQAFSEATGLLVILDELGKYLEHAALSPSAGDLLFLQNLAELAHRSDVPILFITLLHQSFDRYAERLTALERSEWSKVQGRFEDVAFQESYEQNVRLVATALQADFGQVDEGQALRNRAERASLQAASLGLRPAGLVENEFTQLLNRCAPLHPLVVLLLGPLFRKIAQNERSLFAFLSSREPNGFQDYLHHTELGSTYPLYGLPQLYDYLSTSFGATLYSGASGSKWAEIETALERLGADAPINERAAVKCVGLLSLIGNLGNLKPDLAVLAFSLDLSRSEAEELVRKLCDESLLIYRSYKDCYALWGGSDFDLEAQLSQERENAAQGETLAELLTQERPIRPLVARRHSIEKGVVRYFEVGYWDLNTMSDAPSIELGEADGAITLLLGGRPDEPKTRRILNHLAGESRVLVGIPEATRVLQGYLEDIRALRKILNTNPDLAGDAVARKELRTRLQDTQQALQGQLDSLLDRVTAQGHWYYLGEPCDIRSRRQLTETLSVICDRVFPSTPIIRNEMVHRRNLSSACSAARNTLIEAMLHQSYRPALGFEGHPLERSIYDALLARSGIHREEGGTWGFHPPHKDDADQLHALWDKIWECLDVSEVQRLGVGTLFQALRSEPYGMKDGPLPILLCAFLLANEAELAVYEEGGFVPRLTLPHFERLYRNPDRFQIQRYRVDGVRGQIFAQLAEAYAGRKRQNQLLDFVRPIFGIVSNLTPYAKVTKRVSPEAVRVREAVLDATDPVRLLFESLPEALDFKPFGADSSADGDPDAYVQRLQQCIRELQNAYPELIRRLEKRIFDTLGVSEAGEAGRDQVVGKARRLKEMQLEDHLQGILVRVADERLDVEPWVESVATSLANKTPKHWVDRDEGIFETALAEFGRRFHQLEALAWEVGKASQDACRLSILVPGQPARERVLVRESSKSKQVANLKNTILELCRSKRGKLATDAVLLALTEAAAELLDGKLSKQEQGTLDFDADQD